MDEQITGTGLQHVPAPAPEEISRVALPRCFDLREKYQSLDRDSLLRRYMHEALTAAPLSQEETERLAQRHDPEGIVRGHLDLPVFIADEREIFPVLDQLEEGNRGLMEAAARYCRQRPDTPFALWAVWWIRKSLQLYRRSVCLEAPGEWTELAVSMLRLTYRLHRTPDLAEIVADSGLPEDTVRLLLGKYYGDGAPDYGAAEGLSPAAVCDTFNRARREAFRAIGETRRKRKDFVGGGEPAGDSENGGNHDV